MVMGVAAIGMGVNTLEASRISATRASRRLSRLDDFQAVNFDL